MAVYPLKIDKVQYAYRNHYGDKRTKKIDGIIIHHAAGIMTMQGLLDFMSGGSRWVSSNYVIGNDGLLGMAVPHDYRPHTTNGSWDEHNTTLEIGNSTGGPDWKISDKALRKTIELVAYCATRDGWTPKYTGDRNGTIRAHFMYEATACPGPYVKARLQYITDEANKLITAMDDKPVPSPSPEIPSGTLYRVQTGAFKNRANADALEAKLKKDGFDTYMVVANGLYKVQVGAYSKKENANAMEKKLRDKGYDTYMTTMGGASAGSSTVPKKTVTEIAKEIWNGEGNWGTGETRKQRLEAAGYNYNEVQAEINRLYY